MQLLLIAQNCTMQRYSEALRTYAILPGMGLPASTQWHHSWLMRVCSFQLGCHADAHEYLAAQQDAMQRANSNVPAQANSRAFQHVHDLQNSCWQVT